MQVKVKILDPKAVIPVKSHDDDFCYDLAAVSCTELAPGVYRYGFGIALQLKEEDDDSIVTGFTIRPRSSVWETGMVLSNSIGTIDRGYTGEISAVFYHVLPTMPRYQVGDCVAQIHFDFTARNLEFKTVSELDKTERGEGGYGSTNKQR